MDDDRDIILYLGDPICYNTELYAKLEKEFIILRPSKKERERDEFIKALKEKRWCEFSAILRPFCDSGWEMGKWNTALIHLLPDRCSAFASAGSGNEGIDLKVMKMQGIEYYNGAAAASEATGDMAIFHIIPVFRNMQWSIEGALSIDPNRWKDAHRNAARTAYNPSGKALGIIGLGQVGSTIARKAFGCFGMKIYYHDIKRKRKNEEEALKVEFCERLEGMLEIVDCVVVATPVLPTPIITKATLWRFKKGSRLVNIAHGSSVDEEALVGALETGHLSAAGLDVQEKEPYVHPKLAVMRNVTLTSHTAEGTIDTEIAFETLAMENIRQHFLAPSDFQSLCQKYPMRH
ncbi:putative D-mandelate dehydrogenase [Aspergillus steynii IBT 23096]|uniref:Putative D-mandelate dehydrogenase n=1 Tax=Aspergillus steynii IBT 23096 TaxID=1392250 RepID=A0A2I2G424_9EURO|nr:putative D-mandelate dehydrogenase [Aspergillus steynii IBT 23096]PLB47636.1 putative D-mandelate dehydrogenase [Aspergillus steynii IBT 23096]